MLNGEEYRVALDSIHIRRLHAEQRQTFNSGNVTYHRNLSVVRTRQTSVCQPPQQAWHLEWQYSDGALAEVLAHNDVG